MSFCQEPAPLSYHPRHTWATSTATTPTRHPRRPPAAQAERQRFQFNLNVGGNALCCFAAFPPPLEGPLEGRGALEWDSPRSGARRSTVPKGQEKAKKSNKPKLTTKEKQKKKKEKEEKKK